ncbi:hypothetical protein STEG23_023578 [Scotinomys teguina]
MLFSQIQCTYLQLVYVHDCNGYVDNVGLGSSPQNGAAYIQDVIVAKVVIGSEPRPCRDCLLMMDSDVDTKLKFEEITSVINPALDKYFPPDSGVKVIAEPGRYYVASAFTLAVNIIAKKLVWEEQTGSDDEDESNEQTFMYYVNDGVYGSFNCILYDHAHVKALLPKRPKPDEKYYSSSIWGPTCDGLDRIVERYNLPEMHVGDWMLFENMGAYTIYFQWVPKAFYLLRIPAHELVLPIFITDLLTSINSTGTITHRTQDHKTTDSTTHYGLGPPDPLIQLHWQQLFPEYLEELPVPQQDKAKMGGCKATLSLLPGGCMLSVVATCPQLAFSKRMLQISHKEFKLSSGNATPGKIS